MINIINWLEKDFESFCKKRFLYIIISLLLSLLVTVVSWRVHLGWEIIFYWTFLLFFSDIIYIKFTRDDLISKFLFCTTIMGFIELFADHWLVSTIKVLVYPEHSPQIWDSPLYMPFLWATLSLRVIYIGWVLVHKIGLFKTTIVQIGIGACLGFFWESLANGARWWYYKGENLKMIYDAPLFIITAEAILVGMWAYVFNKLSGMKYVFAIPIGIILGLCIWLFYYVSFYILDG